MIWFLVFAAIVVGGGVVTWLGVRSVWRSFVALQGEVDRAFQLLDRASSILDTLELDPDVRPRLDRATYTVSGR